MKARYDGRTITSANRRSLSSRDITLTNSDSKLSFAPKREIKQDVVIDMLKQSGSSGRVVIAFFHEVLNGHKNVDIHKISPYLRNCKRNCEVNDS